MRFLKLRHSLTFRLILMSIVLIIAGGTVRYLLGVAIVRDGIQDLVSAQQLSLAQYVAEDVDQSLRLRQQLLEKLAAELPLPLLQQPQQLEQWLAQHHNYSPLFSLGLVVVPENGVGAIADYPPLDGRTKLDFNDRDWFRASRDTGSFYVGKPGIGRAAHQGVVNMSVPLKSEQGQTVAVLMGVTALNMPGFLDTIEKNKIGKTGSFLLFSQRDQIIVTATEPHLRLKPTPRPGVNRLHDQAMAGWRGAGLTINAFGVENLAAFASVPTANWVVVVRMPTEEALSPANRLLEIVVRSSLVSGLILIVLLVVLLSFTFRPLRQSAHRMRAMAKGETPLAPLPVHRRDEVGEMVESFNALVAKLLESEKQMTFIAHHDALTGLPNRRSFMIRLRQSMALAARQSSKLALLFIDLDGFKKVNDAHGHKVGDQLLKLVADRLLDAMRQSDLMGRFGGDEFVLLSTDCPDRESAARIATKLIATLCEPFRIDDIQINVGASVGIAIFPDQATEIEPFIALADSAMYLAKRDGYDRQAGENSAGARGDCGGYRFAEPSPTESRLES
jgi:diguanylate cyclase (GGDEF)-like protein